MYRCTCVYAHVHVHVRKCFVVSVQVQWTMYMYMHVYGLTCLYGLPFSLPPCMQASVLYTCTCTRIFMHVYVLTYTLSTPWNPKGNSPSVEMYPLSLSSGWACVFGVYVWGVFGCMFWCNVGVGAVIHNLKIKHYMYVYTYLAQIDLTAWITIHLERERSHIIISGIDC